MDAFISKAIRCNFLLIQSLPREEYSAAFKNDPEQFYKLIGGHNVSCLEHISDSLKTHDVCMNVVKLDGCALAFIPDHMKVDAVCWEAIRNDGYALAWVPHTMRTPDMCLAAVKQNGFAFHFVPDELRTLDMYLALTEDERKKWKITTKFTRVDED